jgi:LPXTG-site transpeptidase (sortase) family protein
MKYSKWQLFLMILLLCLGAAGAALAVRPTVFHMEKSIEIKKEVQHYKVTMETVQKVSEEKQEPIPYEQLYKDMQHYNMSLFTHKQSGLTSKSAYEQSQFILTDYGLPDEKFGILSIPKIDLEMPLFLGASEANMASGAAVLSQTSVPIGGTSTNAIIAGHRGWNGYPYFLDIEKLEEGDEVTITNLWGTLTYKVTGIQIISPNDVNAILIRPGKDMITLLTCHPPNSGGKYRYLVFCERVEDIK